MALLVQTLISIVAVIAALVSTQSEITRAIAAGIRAVDLTPLAREFAPWLLIGGFLPVLTAALAVRIVAKIVAGQAEFTQSSLPPARPDLSDADPWTPSMWYAPSAPTRPREVSGVVGLGSALRALLLIQVGVLVLVVLAWLNHLAVHRRVGRGVSVSPREFVNADDLVGAAVSLWILFLVTTAILWCIWQRRAEQVARTLSTDRPRFTPAWSIAWWFIRFANIAMPYVAIQDLWHRSQGVVGRRSGWAAVRLGGDPVVVGHLDRVVGPVVHRRDPTERRGSGRDLSGCVHGSCRFCPARGGDRSVDLSITAGAVRDRSCADLTFARSGIAVPWWALHCVRCL